MHVHNAGLSARFVLGAVGKNPLICVVVKPSTAAPRGPDLTVRMVMGFATRNGFDSSSVRVFSETRYPRVFGIRHLVWNSEPAVNAIYRGIPAASAILGGTYTPASATPVLAPRRDLSSRSMGV